MSLSASERYMCGVHGSSRLGNRNARSPIAITRLLRTAGSTVLPWIFTQARSGVRVKVRLTIRVGSGLRLR